MKTGRLSVILVALVLLLCLALVMPACSQPAPSPAPTTAAPSPAPTTTAPKPAPTTAAPTATPSPSATAKPTATVAPVSFAGKTIAIVVPNAAGGGGDLSARVYAKFLSKYLPGNPTVIVRDMPGADGTIGATYGYLAKPDGLTVAAMSISPMVAQLLGQKAAQQYDVSKMIPLVAVTAGAVFYMWSGIVDKPEDILKAKGIVFGHTIGSGSLFIVAKELIGIPTDRVVLAYTGGGDARRAFLSKEVNTTYDSIQAYTDIIAPMIAKGEVMTICQTGYLNDQGELVKDPAFPASIPTSKELYEKIYGKSPSGTTWEGYKGVLAFGKNYDNPIMLQPGTPDGIVKAYWDAATKMVNDADFQKMISPLVGKDTRWVYGESLGKGFRDNMNMKPEIVQWYRETMKKYGVTVQ